VQFDVFEKLECIRFSKLDKKLYFEANSRDCGRLTLNTIISLSISRVSSFEHLNFIPTYRRIVWSSYADQSNYFVSDSNTEVDVQAFKKKIKASQVCFSRREFLQGIL
jgi:hypothetical protein